MSKEMRDGWASQVLIGELPADFLRLSSASVENSAVANQQGFSINKAYGKLTVTIMEAKLTKNYSPLASMDPYVKLKIGHKVYETHTSYRGGKHPRWKKIIHCYMPQGVQNIYLEIFDERSLMADERIAWANITIPQTVFSGDVIDEWFALNGKQGDGNEGLINLILNYTTEVPITYTPQPLVIYPSPYAAVMPSAMPIYAPGAMQPPPVVFQPPHQPPQPPFQENDLKQLEEMFPHMDKEIIRSVMVASKGNKDKAVNTLLGLNES